MTTIKIINEPKTGKGQNLNVTLNTVSLTYSKDLLNDDGTILMAGKLDSFQIAPFILLVSDSEIVATAKETFKAAIEEAYITYYNAVGGQ